MGCRRADETVDEFVIGVAAHARVSGAHVRRIGQQFLAIGTDIEHDRSDPCGVDPGRSRVDGELAYGDRDASHPPIPDTENLLGVGGYDQVDVVCRGAEILDGGVDAIGVVNTQIHASRSLEFLAVAFDRLSDSRRVHDREHLGEMLAQHPVVQHLVAVM